MGTLSAWQQFTWNLYRTKLVPPSKRQEEMVVSSSDSDGDSTAVPALPKSRRVPGGRLVIRATLTSSDDGDDEDSGGESDGVWDDERPAVPGMAVAPARAARAAAQAAIAAAKGEKVMTVPTRRATGKQAAVTPARAARAAAQAAVAARAAAPLVIAAQGAETKAKSKPTTLGHRKKRGSKLEQVKHNLRDNYDFSTLEIEDDYDSFEDYEEEILEDEDDSDSDAPEDKATSSDESADEDETETDEPQPRASKKTDGLRQQETKVNDSATQDDEQREGKLPTQQEKTKSESGAEVNDKTTTSTRRSKEELDPDLSELSGSSTEDEYTPGSNAEEEKESGDDELEDEDVENASDSKAHSTERVRVSSTLEGRGMYRSEVRMVGESVGALMQYTSSLERRAIARGERVVGPPIHEPLSQIDVLARKFRWPLHVRNVRNTSFSQDATEIIDDYEIVATKDSGFEESNDDDRFDQFSSETSAFASAPRPIMAATALAFRHEKRKRRREDGFDGEQDRKNVKVHPDDAISTDSFMNLSRTATAFTDSFVESLLKANLTEMQGAGDRVKYSQRAWTPLPVSRRPIANWRFVFEHMLMNRDAQFGESSGSFWPRMKPTTMERIRDRLKAVNDQSWRPEDDDFFERMTREDLSRN